MIRKLFDQALQNRTGPGKKFRRPLTDDAFCLYYNTYLIIFRTYELTFIRRDVSK